MYSYISGKVTDIESNYIVLDNNGIGYMIYTASPYSFNKEDNYKVYIYQYVREDENSLYGFKSVEEKDLFLKLIGVKGLGCKMALPMLATGSISDIKTAIETDNINYLKKFPKIGDKVARQIILDLKGKLVNNEDKKDIVSTELVEALQGLGYKTADINKVVKNIDKSRPIENQIKQALILMLK